MIEDLLIEFDEMGFVPTTVCPDSEQYAIDWRERVRKEFACLTAENAELKARLKKAVELPEPQIYTSFSGMIVKYYTVEEHAELYDTPEQAEARLAELKGGRE